MSFMFWKVWFVKRTRAHAGFVKKFRSIFPIIAKRIDKWEDNRWDGTGKIIFRGYSKGGALATLAYITFAHMEPNTELICFGNPRVVSRNPIKDLDVVRAYLPGDIVTNLPPWLFGYRHVGEKTRLGKWRLPLPKWHADWRYEETLRKMYDKGEYDGR